MKRTNSHFGALLTLVLGIVFSIVFAIGANAQAASGSAQQAANLSLSNVIELMFVNGSGGALSTTLGTVNEMIDGKELPDQDMRVRSNKPFRVTVAPSATNFVYSGSAIVNNILPASTGLRIKVSNNNTGGHAGGGWLALGNLVAPATIIDNCNAGANQSFSVRCKTIGGGVLAPGTYSIEVIYTATQL